MLPSLLLEGLDTWISLTKKLHASDKLGHVRRDLRLQRNSNNGCFLQSSAFCQRLCISRELATHIAEDTPQVEKAVLTLTKASTSR